MKLTLFALILTSTTLLAAPKKSPKITPMNMTPEQRVNLATVHENMASCLKSDKTTDACRVEMQSNCKSMMGDDACNLMSGRMMNGDMMDKNKKMNHRK